ncbi:MAG: hypothetical protein AB4042_02300, partial [Leptolyngbyaceae cyanobacterium]
KHGGIAPTSQRPNAPTPQRLKLGLGQARGHCPNVPTSQRPNALNWAWGKHGGIAPTSQRPNVPTPQRPNPL